MRGQTRKRRPGELLLVRRKEISRERVALERLRTSNTHPPEMLIPARPVIALPTRRLVRAPRRVGVDDMTISQGLVAAGDGVEVVRVEAVIVEFEQDALVGPVVRPERVLVLGWNLVLACCISSIPTSRRRNAPRLDRPFALLARAGGPVRGHRRSCVSALYRLSG